MAIYDNNGTNNYEIGSLYDNDGTTNYQIGKFYDNDGTTNSLIYSSEKIIELSSLGTLTTSVPTRYKEDDPYMKSWTSAMSTYNGVPVYKWGGEPYNSGGNNHIYSAFKFPNLIDNSDGYTNLHLHLWFGKYCMSQSRIRLYDADGNLLKEKALGLEDNSPYDTPAEFEFDVDITGLTSFYLGFYMISWHKLQFYYYLESAIMS